MIIDSYPLLQRAFYYSPLSFLRGSENVLTTQFLDTLRLPIADNGLQCMGEKIRIWLRYLDWDSTYFSCPTYRLEFVDWDTESQTTALEVSDVLSELNAELTVRHGKFYLFTEIPSEDVVMLQALNLSGLRLIETRLTYFYENLQHYSAPFCEEVRVATESDIKNIREVAAQARNGFDRYHADPFFSVEVADAYLAEYAEQCVLGLTDVVLVPNCDTLPADAFICGSLNVTAPDGIRVGRLVLAAVSNARRGWYRHLNNALLSWMKTNGMKYCVNTTQSTNRAVIHVCEQIGYHYGRSTHLFATYTR